MRNRDDLAHDVVQMGQHVDRRIAHNSQSPRSEPCLAHGITRRPIAAGVRLAINLDDEARGGAVEIANIVVDRMLSAEA